MRVDSRKAGAAFLVGLAVAVAVAGCGTRSFELTPDDRALLNETRVHAIDVSFALAREDRALLDALCRAEDSLVERAVAARKNYDDAQPIEQELDLWPNGYSCDAYNSMLDGDREQYNQALIAFGGKWAAYQAESIALL